ncbi:hypothetical protein C8R44DRAFT_632134, partial [Mycena epipterygia]
MGNDSGKDVILVEQQDYDDFEFATRVKLKKMRVWGIVNREEPRPPGAPHMKNVKAWVQRRDEAAAVIVGHVHKQQYSHIRELEEDPAAMWERLRDIFATKGLGGAVGLWKDFHRVNMDDNTTM